ncbi:hypothetical protein ACI797_03715 [Geodermatophilus sp. SYSU D00691]
MARRTPRQSRALGLWTAAWLFVLLVALLLWLGDLTLQWPVLLVPLLWALVAVRPRPGSGAVRRRPPDRWDDEPHEDRWDDDRWDDGWPPAHDDWPPAHDDRPPRPRTPPTRELPWLPEVPRDRREE